MLTEICLLIAIISSFILIFVLSKKYSDKKIAKILSILFIELIIWCSGVLLQKLFADSYPANLIYFDYITYIGACTVFPTALYVSYCFKNGDKKTPKWYLLFFIIPCICLVLLWTNDYHHLFYNVYSTNFAETEYGIVFYINTIYTYAVAFVFIIQMIRASILNSGFLSKQTFMFTVGSLIPLVVNVLGTAKIINISIYITPILFVITLMCYALAIFKYKALNITPVAFRTVIDTMSDAYVVISDDGTIADMNKTFERKFGKDFDIAKEDNLFDIFEASKALSLKELKESINKTRKTGNIVTEEYHFKNNRVNRYFEVDIHPISSKSNSKVYIGTLLLFKDITQHKLDIKEIQEKQDIIVKQGQLASIGELAGGVAHDINTPISAIKTGILMLNQNESRTEEEKQILERMDNCATKIINIVNSMRNQIRNLGGDTNVEFKISDVVNDIKIITYHEAKKNNSEVTVEIKDDLKIQGDPTKLGQVLTNLVVNGIQAYKEKSGGKVEVTVTKADAKTALIKVKDYAGGLDDSITPYIFKNILTTKGTKGTGLGLYLAYSVIKGNFNGDITFDTTKGEGTTFYITIPLK